jgi:hypothetical protein
VVISDLNLRTKSIKDDKKLEYMERRFQNGKNIN